MMLSCIKSYSVLKLSPQPMYPPYPSTLYLSKAGLHDLSLHSSTLFPLLINNLFSDKQPTEFSTRLLIPTLLRTPLQNPPPLISASRLPNPHSNRRSKHNPPPIPHRPRPTPQTPRIPPRKLHPPALQKMVRRNNKHHPRHLLDLSPPQKHHPRFRPTRALLPAHRQSHRPGPLGVQGGRRVVCDRVPHHARRAREWCVGGVARRA